MELPDEQPPALPDRFEDGGGAKAALPDMEDLFGPTPSPDGEDDKDVFGNPKRSKPGGGGGGGGVDRNVVPKVHDTREPASTGAATAASSSAGVEVPYVKTRHCPACESGMVAPGIRHSAQCERNNDPVKRRKRSLPPVQVEPEAAQEDDMSKEGVMNA